MNGRSRNVLAISLCLFLFIALIFVVVVGNIQKNNKTKELVKASEGTDKTVEEKTEEPVATEIKNPYEKIKNQKTTSILILGDYIAQGEGVEQKNKWSAILSDSMEKDYKAKPSISLLTNKDQGIIKTLEDYNTKEATKKYDFAIICVGADDVGILKIEQFRKAYESLIRKIKEGNESCEVISIIESSIKLDKTYPDTIKTICDYYGISYIDVREVFKQANVAYSNLTTQDGQTPNVEGYKLYGNSIYKFIKTNVDKGKAVTSIKKELLYK